VRGGKIYLIYLYLTSYAGPTPGITTPIIRKLFKKIDATEELGRVVTELEKILSSDPDIRDVAWSEGGK